MKKILIPIDFSFNSYNAIDYAVHFFKNIECQFYFLNTYTYDVNNINAIHLLQSEDNTFEKTKSDSEKNLGLAIQKYSCNNKNDKHRFNAISKCSNLIEGIKNTIKEIDIDLVLMAGKIQSQQITNKYSRNTESIIENIIECPVMIIPHSANVKKNLELVLISSFETELPTTELKKWYDLLIVAKAKSKIIVLNNSKDMSNTQKMNLTSLLNNIQDLSGYILPVHYIETKDEAKKFAQLHSECIFCIIDTKLNLWRKLGLSHSQIVDFGPFNTTPLIALHS